MRDLARLSLVDPEYVAVHEKSAHATPKNLKQHVMIVPAEDKIETIFSFIKAHKKAKIICFVSSCKQASYLYEVFCKLRPGLPVMHLTGKMKQGKRMYIYNDFVSKPACILFATDIASRGLDWPKVDWVVQFDCPEDVKTYIHRAGRTARFDADGHALTLLLPSEEAMMKRLEEARVPVAKTFANPNRLLSCTKHIQSFLSSDPELKHLAQRAFQTYLRSIWVQADKEVFDVHAIDAEKLAASFGLAVTPRIRFLDANGKRDKNKAGDSGGAEEEAEAEAAADESAGASEPRPEPAKTKTRRASAASSSSSSASSAASSSSSASSALREKPRGKTDRMMKRKNATVLSEAFSKHVTRDAEDEADDDDLEGIMVLKRRDHELDPDIDSKYNTERAVTKSMRKKLAVRNKLAQRFIIDDDGTLHDPIKAMGRGMAPSNDADATAYAERKRGQIVERDLEDKERARTRIKEMHVERRQKRKARENGGTIGSSTAMLGGSSDEDASGDDESSGGASASSASSAPAARPHKRRRAASVSASESDGEMSTNLADDEARALALLEAGA